ncbi:MAG: hypothetical protein IH586_04340, partial [Anaerolineaceae bacterium]|nr:hypothetical protein [Anaerolineaceae bacterium]
FLSIRTHENRQWWIPVIIGVLVLSCLVLLVVNAGTGLVIEGQRTRFRLESVITNYPFCPPEIPCPFSLVLNRNHWVVWALRDTYTRQGVEITYQKLIDIPLWW